MSFRLIATTSIVSLFFMGTECFAEPSGIDINIRCPSTNQLQNFGDYIAGPGSEKIAGQPDKEIYFKSENNFNSPIDPNNYRAAGTDYVPTFGKVVCIYAANQFKPEHPDFTMAYNLTNGKGGKIMQQSNDTITIKIPFGLK